VPESGAQNDPISYAQSLAKEIENDYGAGALEGFKRSASSFEDEAVT
jgi:hypothetical protein